MARDESSILHNNYWGSVFQMLDDMPQNRSLYRDSGLWSILDGDTDEPLYEQDANETFLEFITRAYNAENIYQDWQD
jgi:hypothetical protein